MKTWQEWLKENTNTPEETVLIKSVRLNEKKGDTTKQEYGELKHDVVLHSPYTGEGKTIKAGEMVHAQTNTKTNKTYIHHGAGTGNMHHGDVDGHYNDHITNIWKESMNESTYTTPEGYKEHSTSIPGVVRVSGKLKHDVTTTKGNVFKKGEEVDVHHFGSGGCLVTKGDGTHVAKEAGHYSDHVEK